MEDHARELLNVEDKLVPPDHIDLDPNNPRFVGEGTKRVPDERIADRANQESALKRIQKDGLDDVKDKIQVHGFQRHERVFVKAIPKTSPTRYVVLEGNRRVASAKLLIQQYEKGEIELPDPVRKSLKEIPCVVYLGNFPDIAWVVQGLRHITGIKGWNPIQQARFIERVAVESGQSEVEVGRRFSLNPRDTAKLVDALRLHRQAQTDREYGDQIDDSKFAMFHEGVFDKRTPIAKEFLGWDDSKRQATQSPNLSRLLGLITSGAIRRAIDVRDKLPALIQQKDLLDKVVDSEMTLDEAHAAAKIRDREKEEQRLDLARELEQFEEALDEMRKLPVSAVALDAGMKTRFLKLLRAAQEIIEQHIKFLSKSK